MPTRVVSRRAESAAIENLLASVSSGPSALTVEGEAGIGKTTLWLAALERARELGFRVLSTRAAPTESALAYSSLAGLLEAVDEAVLADLPPPQRLAVGRVLSRVGVDGPVTDQRAAAAGFVSVVERLAEASPVFVGIDDLQWLDSPSALVVSSAARRLTGPVAFLATVRTGPNNHHFEPGLELRRPDALNRIRVGPLSVGALHAVLTERVGRSFSRPKMTRIFDVSGGNPFYAIEIARSMDEQGADGEASLPTSLAALVRARIGALSVSAREVLLAAACLADPTVEAIAQANNADAERILAVLEDAENKGIVEIRGHRVRFSHPLLTRGVYSDTTAARRRAMHRRLAAVAEEPELKARHLALAAATGDQHTLSALDTAAELARKRGAPAAAAELLGLAIGLGGDTPQRRIRSAAYHFNAGDTERARVLLLDTIERLEPATLRAEASSLLGFVHLFDDGFAEAVDVLTRALDEAGGDLALRTRLLITLSYARYNAGRFGAATGSIEDAVAHAERLGQPHPLSQALSMRATLWFLRGDGLDTASLARAVDLDDQDADIPMAFRPRMQNAMLLGWTGQLDRAHHELASIRRRCMERGEENELMFVAVHTVLVAIWRGNFTDAALIAEDTMERALQLGGDVPMFVAMTIRAALAAYAGQENQARRATSEALAASQRCSASLLVVWTITTLGFLEVSLGNYDAALGAVAPLLSNLDAAPRATEIPAASFVPDAVESLVALGRLADAEPLVSLLEQNGARLDRAWMLAVGARCRAMLLAAYGDVDAAYEVVQTAMIHHARLPMPFERARTQLLVGQIQRRQRKREAASATLREALAAFEELATPLWADRARSELKRASGVRTQAELTASEQRVAELAASGVTNREMAAVLFISPKTVEANLSRIYRKLNIRSRAELGRIMERADG
ncbi:ATP-binding protein [Mycobacterium deserti]|uniref:LuxR C-terminal-related transcriptional regulator n=1 Tax=Mycobacterium deserti TaxID=2978347 RepID=A0ABT2MHS9_9MYCO|nr:LuxR family transcriptional regulator [Mycobacterium deserti]MCT7661833.1 LuxR C-terminal-related transcriptional regulator [Mycobacterium deserti]